MSLSIFAARLVFDGVGDECADLFGRRQLAGQIERDAAQEAGVVHGRRGLDFQALQLGVDRAVDVVVLRQRLPRESRLRIEHRHRQRRQIALVAHQQRGFADARAGDRCIVNGGHVGGVAFDHGQLGDVAGAAIGVDRRDFDGRGLAGRFHEDLLRLDLQPPDAVFGGIAEGDALRDPVIDGLVVLRVRFEAKTAAVRDLLRRFGEHQAARRLGAIEAAAGEIVEQRFVIELRIVAAQRELETVLPLGRAVAGARCAADFIEDRRDVAQEGRIGRQQRLRNSSGRSASLFRTGISSGDFEWDGPGDDYFISIVRAEAAADVQIVARRDRWPWWW